MTTTQVPSPLVLPNDDRFLPSIIREFLKDGRRPDLISLAGGLPANDCIPVEHISAALERVITRKGACAFQYGESAGEPDLLNVLAGQLGVSESQVLVTSGSQQALSLCLAVLDPGPSSSHPATAAIEDPGYVGALQLLRAHRYEPLPIPVDRDGLRVDVLATHLEAGKRITACYVNPNFQNPTGTVLSQTRGDLLVDLAEKFEFAVIADDPYRQLCFDPATKPIELRDSPNVIRLGSFSKTLAPGLRVGWMEAAPDILIKAERAKQAADLHTNTLSQFTAADLLADDRWWTTHLDSLRDRYRDRRDALVGALAAELPEADVTSPQGGFFCWLPLPFQANGQVTDSSELLTRTLTGVASAPVGFVPGSAFSASKRHSEYVRLSYSNADPSTFGEAIARLAAAI